MSALRACLVLLLCATAPVFAEEDLPNYRFTLNGDPISPRIHSLQGDPESPRPGDLAAVHDYLLVLGEPGDHDFRIDWKDVATPVYRKVGETERLVAASAKRGGKVTLQKLDATARKGLRGVRLAVWSDEVAQMLGDVDLERCAFTLDEGVGAAGPGLGLPAGLRHLRISRPTAARLATALEGLPGLHSLIVKGYGQVLDAAPIVKLGEIAYLEVIAKSLRGNGTLG
ncbi:MAG: hypothetical protein GY704_02750, partial [Phycisphaeraceae bacterium]|nr:hypothetical protein [Phycisphaeraceae bacterium]